jgi:tRNA(Ile)-lysidine synthase
VATVDHRLRPESAREAAQVAETAAALGLPARVLVWDGALVSSRIEETARAARYALLAAAARDAGASHVLTAHHRDDQAETLLLRLGRGSGLTGLGGMRAERPLAPGITLARPLLELPRRRLAATVAAAGLTAADDPSNRDERFARARLRAMLPVLARQGIAPAGLARTAARLARASDALDHYAARLVAEAVQVDALAVAAVDRHRLADVPAEVRLRALARIIAALGGSARPGLGEALEALDLRLAEGSAFTATLGGIVLDAGDATMRLYREVGRQPQYALVVRSGHDDIWDGRFRVVVEADGGAPLQLGPLGEAGRRQLGAAAGKASARAMAALPALRRGSDLVAVPTLGLAPPAAAGLALRVDCIVAQRLATM